MSTVPLMQTLAFPMCLSLGNFQQERSCFTFMLPMWRCSERVISNILVSPPYTEEHSRICSWQLAQSEREDFMCPTKISHSSNLVQTTRVLLRGNVQYMLKASNLMETVLPKIKLLLNKNPLFFPSPSLKVVPLKLTFSMARGYKCWMILLSNLLMPSCRWWFSNCPSLLFFFFHLRGCQV